MPNDAEFRELKRSYEENEKTGNPPLARLLEFSARDNIADMLETNTLNEIGRRAYAEYQIDEDSRSEWLKRNEQAIELANQVIKEKSYPWPGAANIKYPLIADAAIQFNARAHPSIIKGSNIVKATTIGDDSSGAKRERADRVSKHMSYQLLYQMDEWEEETDKLLIILPIMGNVFRKIYYSPSEQRNMSKLVRAENLVYNYESNFYSAPRLTEKINLYQQDIIEKQRMGLFRDVDLHIEDGEDDPEDLQEFIEQHRREDLDGDGYKEPYIVTVHCDTKEVVRIVAGFDVENIIVRFQGRVDTLKEHLMARQRREENLGFNILEGTILKIDPAKYYVKYSFIPSLDGKGYDVGLGQLLGPLSETINTNLNQMLDAGTLSNLQGGFISDDVSSFDQRGEFTLAPNEWMPISGAFGPIRDKIYPFNFQGPNATLFSLLSFLIESGKELAAINMSTEAAGANESPTTYMARLSEGLRVFNGVFKRIHRSLKAEYGMLFKLNRTYLDEKEYFTVMDDRQAIARRDYLMDDVDVIPVSDPSVSTTEQRMAKAQVVYQVGKNNPRYHQYQVEKEYLDAMDIAGIDRLLMKDEEMPEPPPDPEVVEMQAKIEKMGAETERIRAETAQTYSDIQAKVVELKQKFEELDIKKLQNTIEYLSKVVTEQENYKIHKKLMGGSDGQGRVPGVDGSSPDTEGSGGSKQ